MLSAAGSSMTGMKLLRVLYEINDDERKVIMWHVSATDLPDFGVI
jgi:hypothetical protein